MFFFYHLSLSHLFFLPLSYSIYISRSITSVYGGKGNSLDSSQATLRRRMLSTPMPYVYTTRTSSTKRPLTKGDNDVVRPTRSAENFIDNSVIPDYALNQQFFSSANEVWADSVEGSLFHAEQNSSDITSSARVQEWLRTCQIEINSQRAEQQQLLNTNTSISGLSFIFISIFHILLCYLCSLCFRIYPNVLLIYRS